MGGIGGSGVQSENPKIFGERHSRQESGDFVDTLNHRFKTVIFFLVLIRSFKPHKTNIECFIETILGGFLYNPLIIGQLNIAIH